MCLEKYNIYNIFICTYIFLMYLSNIRIYTYTYSIDTNTYNIYIYIKLWPKMTGPKMALEKNGSYQNPQNFETQPQRYTVIYILYTIYVNAYIHILVW